MREEQEKLLSILKGAGPASERAAKAREYGWSIGTILRYEETITAALEDGTLSPEPALIAALTANLSDLFIDLWAQKIWRPFAPTLTSALLDELKKASSGSYPEGNTVCRLIVALTVVNPGLFADDTYDKLFHTALAYVPPQDFGRQHRELLRVVLATMPEDRREKLVLKLHNFSVPVVDWEVVDLAPTPLALDTILKEALAWKKERFKYDPRLGIAAARIFRLLAPQLLTRVLAALAGDGKKAPMREVLVRSLAEARTLDAVPTLLAFVDDSNEATAKAAKEGLAALGAEVKPLLEAMKGSKKAKERVLAERLLSELGLTGEVAAAPQEKPEALEAVDALEASLVAARGEGWWSQDLSGEPKTTQALGVLRAIEEKLKTSPDISSLFYTLQRAVSATNSPANDGVWARLLYVTPDNGYLNFRHYANELAKHLAAQPADTQARIGAALAALYRTGLPANRKEALRRLAEHLPGPMAPVLATALGDSVKPNRAAAVEGLIAAGEAALPWVYPALSLEGDALVAAAEVLRASPSGASVAPLKAALEKEKNKKRRELLEGALSACELVSGGPVDLAVLDARLAARAGSRPTPDKLGALALSWEDGTEVSAGAVTWVLGALMAGEGGPEDAELREVRRRLRDEDCHRIADEILQHYPLNAAHKWALYQLAVVGAEPHLDALGRKLESLVYHESAAFAAHGVEVLRRHGGAAAIRWLDHWAREGKGKLRQESKAAIASLCAARGATQEDLVDASTPTTALDAPAALAGIRGRLEGGMIVGRAWTRATFQAFFLSNPLVLRAAAGVLVREEPAGRLALLEGDGTLTDLTGRGVAPADDATLTLPHPITLSDADRKAWADRLRARQLEQPFPQVARPFASPSAKQAAFKVTAAVMFAWMEENNWREGHPQDAGWVYDAWKPVAGGWSLTLSHSGYLAGTKRPMSGNQIEITSTATELEGAPWPAPPTPPGLDSEAEIAFLALRAR